MGLLPNKLIPISIGGWLLFCASLFPQEQQPRELRGDGHLLGETAEQFFSEGFVGDVLRACQEKDWKSVSKHLGDVSKANARDHCATEALSKQQAISGTRLEYHGRGNDESLRQDTFTFDGGQLVKIGMTYLNPIANVEGHHPKSFSELFAGLREAYGAPSKDYIEPFLTIYGAKLDAHRAVWMGDHDVIHITEQPGEGGRTEIVAETIAEYKRAAQAPKAENPLR